MNSDPDPKSCWPGCSFSVKVLTHCLEVQEVQEVTSGENAHKNSMSWCQVTMNCTGHDLTRTEHSSPLPLSATPEAVSRSAFSREKSQVLLSGKKQFPNKHQRPLLGPHYTDPTGLSRHALPRSLLSGSGFSFSSSRTSPLRPGSAQSCPRQFLGKSDTWGLSASRFQQRLTGSSCSRYVGLLGMSH